MTDTLLRSLRERIVDESEPPAGLLRNCLLRGAETGSISLREWAHSELEGYQDEAGVPDYRQLHGSNLCGFDQWQHVEEGPDH